MGTSTHLSNSEEKCCEESYKVLHSNNMPMNWPMEIREGESHQNSNVERKLENFNQSQSHIFFKRAYAVMT